MKQRAMIAMALACDPKLIIGDEPPRRWTWMILGTDIEPAGASSQRTIHGYDPYITHDLAILGETCDKIAVMYAGKIVETAASGYF
jgi:ABC-type dipeptide/oligopeptide/nickel transport system ATPase component